jgi:hypothetical protein
MAIKRGWAVGDGHGPDAFFEGATFVEALAEAEKFYPRHTRIEFAGDIATLNASLTQATPNASIEKPSAMPEKAFWACGLSKKVAGKLVSRVNFDEAMNMSLDEAFERLRPIFQYKYDSGPYIGELAKVYGRIPGIQNSLMTKNYKLKKSQKPIKGIERGWSAGPNLLPHKLAREFSNRKLPLIGEGLCVGSNDACRESCLVYTGNNPIGDKHGKAKLVRTEALLLEPNAWVRMWVSSIEKHIVAAAKEKSRPYVRPNVLSDIPWELVCPEIFGFFEKRERSGRLQKTGVRFYDYTKVPGRKIAGLNYDMTFSFSGTNESYCLSELERGYRVAVVYWLRSKGDSVTRKRWNGYRVVDGDLHDMRPLDPNDVVVGLTWKADTRKKGTGSKVPSESSLKFIRETFFDTDTGDLMVAATPADLGAQPDDDVEPNEVAIGP